MLPGYDYVALLQPTSPLRTAEDIDACLEQCVKRGANACVSVVEAEQSPYWMYRIDDANCLHPLVEGKIFARRQDLPKAYMLNGAIYVAKCEWLLHSRTFLAPDTVAHEMPKNRSFDLDSETDFIVVENALTRRVINPVSQ
jgi:CMP-N,N'-diacetyllegionaminic acid synthase